jgi:hypothetical protein
MPVVDNRLTIVVDNSSVKGSTSVADSLLVAVTDKPSAVVVELLTTVADRPPAVEPMHNIDNRLSEPMFDTCC